MPRETLIQQRRDTEAQWLLVDPVLANGEFGVETDTNKFKIGDGTTKWSDLAYQGGSGGGSTTLDGLTDVAITSPANGDVIVYDSSSSSWKNQAISTTGGASFSGSYSGTTWTVEHNLGYRPAVTTMDNALTPNQVEGTVNHVDANNLTVTFTSIVTGNIYLS